MVAPVPSGSQVGIITPSSSLSDPKDIRNGLQYLRQELGYQLVLGDYTYGEYHHQGGTPQQKAEDIMRFFADPQIKAIFATRGGYGSQSVLPLLDYEIIRRNPKPIIGFSDTTALQMGIYAQTGNVSYAGTLLTFDFASRPIHPQTAASLKRLLNGQGSEIRSGTRVNSGNATGILLGTNLCVLQSLAGTPYYPDLQDSILVLEDVGDVSYRFERMLLQLKQMNGFSGVRGVIFGQFAGCTLDNPLDKDIHAIIDEFAKDLKIPVIKDFALGHVAARYAIPLGVKAFLDADNCLLRFPV